LVLLRVQERVTTPPFLTIVNVLVVFEVDVRE